MAKIDAAKTKDLMEEVILGHMSDWKTMLFNRHAKIKPGKKGSPLKPKADWAYLWRCRTAPTDFPGVVLFCEVSISYTTFERTVWLGDKHLPTWGLRLMERYWGMRHPETGLGAGIFNVRKQRMQGQNHYEIPGDKAGTLGARTWTSTNRPDFDDGLRTFRLNSELGQRLIDESVKEWITRPSPCLQRRIKCGNQQHRG